MVTTEEVERQLKKVKFNTTAWGRAEVKELPKILVPDEQIYDAVNGIYEGGFALLVATNFRVLLIDKKPMNYLTVEDLRFDMINEIDYSHRLLGAKIIISTGSKTLRFTSYNQPRLRKLITHVQQSMADAKKQQFAHQEDQSSHLEQINQQLQAYLIAQHEQQQRLQEQLEKAQKDKGIELEGLNDQVKPAPELADFLYAQRLLAEHRARQKGQPSPLAQPVVPEPVAAPPIASAAGRITEQESRMADLYAEGMQEIFGKHMQSEATTIQEPEPQRHTTVQSVLEINPISIAYSKLPMALRNRKFGRPSFHAHSRSDNAPITPETQPAATQ